MQHQTQQKQNSGMGAKRGTGKITKRGRPRKTRTAGALMPAGY